MVVISSEQQEKLREAMAILQEVFLTEGREQLAPKYINFEMLTPKQAERKDAINGSFTLRSKSYPTTTIYTINGTIIKEPK